jgi:hypothetical protein
MKAQRFRFGVVGTSVAVISLSGCAAEVGTAIPVPPSHAPAGTSTSPAGAGSSAAIEIPQAADCAGYSKGFAISVAAGFTGAPTPLTAVREFIARASVAGFTPGPDAVWTLDGQSGQSDAATLRSGQLRLHAVRLANKNWAVDSGESCG